MDQHDVSAEEEVSLSGDFDNVEELRGNFLSADDLEDDEEKPKKKVIVPDQAEPSMSDPNWHEFVMRQFEDNEMYNGCPSVHGLRRVVRKLLGPIIKSSARVVQPAMMVGGHEKTTLLQPTTVEYTVVILMSRPEYGDAAFHVEFGDCADVYMGNTDPDFARHAAATASTKSEARCLRKALQLRGIAAEETTRVPLDMAAVDGKIDPVQVNFINVLCSRNNVNARALINAGKAQYDSIMDVPYGAAAKMVEYLSGLENKGAVPDKLRGYDKNWRDK